MPKRKSWLQPWRIPFLAALFLASSCSLDRGTLTAVATHNVAVPSQPLGRAVEGSDCVNFAFGIPISGSLTPDLREAIDNALANEPDGNALENVVVYQDRGPFSNCVRVKGDVVRIVGEAQTSLSTLPGGR